MSVEASSGVRESAGYKPDPYAGYSDVRGDGWLSFAGIMLSIVGVLNVIGGIAAIDDANVYAGNAQYTFGDLNTWGWVLLCTGVVQFLAALGIFARNQFARWLGVGFASLNMLAQFLFLPAFPLWAIAIIAVDTLIIYGLVAYGGREGRA
jgi:hypothetical protein